jgi:hypothetical protein
MAKKKHGGGPKKDTIKRQEMAANYGFALAFMNSDPELKKLFNSAVAGTWTPQKFVARLRNTKWFKHHSASVRNAILQQTADPATYTANLQKMKASVRDSWGKMYGAGTLSESNLNRWSATAFRLGWSEEQLVDRMSHSMNYQTLLKNSHLGGTAAETRSQLNELVANYGVGLGDRWKALQLKRVMEGGGTIGGVQDTVRQLAKQQYGAFADQIDAGKTMTEIADPYMQKYADLLENPDVDLHNPLIQKALTMKDQNGKPAAMNLGDFAQQVRKDPKWQYTRNAHEQVANVAGSLLSSFGLIA